MQGNVEIHDVAFDFDTGNRLREVIDFERPETIALQTVTYTPTRVLDGVKSLSYGANMLATRRVFGATWTP